MKLLRPHHLTHRLLTFSEGTACNKQKPFVRAKQRLLPPASAAAENIRGGTRAEVAEQGIGKGEEEGAGVGFARS